MFSSTALSEHSILKYSHFKFHFFCQFAELTYQGYRPKYYEPYIKQQGDTVLSLQSGSGEASI